MKKILWKLLYRDWEDKSESLVPGYTVLLPVPGDMPFLSTLALKACRAQKDINMHELFLIPDHIPAKLKSFYEQIVLEEADVPSRLVRMSTLDYIASKYCGNSQRHWLQLFNGTKLARTTSLLFHDSDLFPENNTFFANHYRKATNNEFDVYGVSEVWDSWYRENGYSHVTATWEAMVSKKWLNSFPPYQHRGQNAAVGGMRHEFDTILLTQCLTSPKRIGFCPEEVDFIHFNYVVSTYRNYQKTTGNYLDTSYKLLLIRLLIDLFDESDWSYDIPSFVELSQNLGNSSGNVIYPGRDDGNGYFEFRHKLQKFICLDLLNSQQRTHIVDNISIFDSFYQYE
jgi:hypothetical protein